MWQFMKRGIVVAAGLVMASLSWAIFTSWATVLRCFARRSCWDAVALIAWRWRVAQALMVACVLIGGLQFTDGRFREASAGTDFVLYQKNLLYFERDRTAFVADVLASGGLML
jgi:hypothetical protein